MTSHSKGIIRDNLGRWGMDLYLCGASDVAIIDTVIAMFRVETFDMRGRRWQ